MAETQTKQRLRRGFGDRIAEATGYTRHYVYKVSAGQRHNQYIEELLRLAHIDRRAFAERIQYERETQALLDDKPVNVQ